MLTRSAVAVLAVILLREERRHRVGMGVVQLDTVEACFAGACRRFRKDSRKHSRQLANVLQVHVVHALASAVAQVVELARAQGLVELVIRTTQKAVAQFRLRGVFPFCVFENFGQLLAMLWADLEKAPEKLLRRWPPLDRKKVDNLDEEPGLAFTRAADCLDKLAQSRNKAIVSDPEERPARDIADARRLDDDRTRLAAREPLVPIEDLSGDEAFLGRAPRHHGGNPRPVTELDRSDTDGAEERRTPRFVRARPRRIE